jgi:hypothetical protein
MPNRRFTRLTNAFSKRVEMYRLSLAMTFFAYNLIKKHRSPGGKTPAMAAGITDHVFTVRDMMFRSEHDDRRRGPRDLSKGVIEQCRSFWRPAESLERKSLVL